MRIALVAPHGATAAARASVRAALRHAPGHRPVVLTTCPGYRPVADEEVRTVGDLPLTPRELHLAAVTLEPEVVDRLLLATLVGSLVRDGETVVALTAGVELRAVPTDLAGRAEAAGLCLVGRSRTTVAADDREPSLTDLLVSGAWSPDLLVAAPAGAGAVDAWAAAVRDWRTGGTWLDLVAGEVPHDAVRAPGALLSAWTSPDVVVEDAADGGLLADGDPVVAVDLADLDPRRPWVLAGSLAHPRLLLSDHPALARLCARAAAERLADGDACGGPDDGGPPFRTLSTGTPVHPQIRTLYRRTLGSPPAVPGEPSAEPPAAEPTAEPPPDPFDPADTDRLRAWLLDPVPAGHPAPVARYLASVWSSRPDLRSAFPLVPGPHSSDLVAWAETYGRLEPEYDADLVDAAVLATRRSTTAPPVDPTTTLTPGVNVVGYLAGELGVGESARLVRSALEAAGAPVTTVPVALQLQSRQRASFLPSASSDLHDVSLLCVNADQTPLVAGALPRLAAGYRIGMWYWEVESFPPEQHVGFAHVDEVWVATDFVRDAIAPHSPVPVRTVPPPLPQGAHPGARGTDGTHRAAVAGIPTDRPVVLFAFDHLSTTERKNPWGLVTAFRRAFRPGEGPVLVLKSINADRAVADAERLRLLVRDEPDVVLLEQYLSAEERDALMAACTVYVSLHRSEGLGLTLAEAMAAGKPVVATAYSGNTQFMTDANSYLVPWTPTPIPPGHPPYPAGSTWADPDLDAAAAILRRVVDDPAAAAAVGRRAAEDIRRLHSPAVAGARMVARLDEIRAERSAAAPGAATPAARLRARLRDAGR